MNWNPNAKYRCLAIFQEFGDKKVIVFNLYECQQVFSEIREADDGTKKRSTTVNMPLDRKGRFGYAMDELDAKARVDFDSTLITIDNKTGERQVAHIAPKFPTPEELIHQPYGGIRSRKEEPDEVAQSVSDRMSDPEKN